MIPRDVDQNISLCMTSQGPGPEYLNVCMIPRARPEYFTVHDSQGPGPEYFTVHDSQGPGPEYLNVCMIPRDLDQNTSLCA